MLLAQVSNCALGLYLVTAGHCSDFQNSVTITTPGSAPSGYTTFVPTLAGDYGNPSASGYLLDAALVSYVYAGTLVDNMMYYGTSTTSSKIAVDATGNMPWGVNLCSNSAATGLRCGFERDTYQTRVCIVAVSGTCVRYADVIKVSSTFNSIMFGSGDSGGPIYWINGSGEREIVAFVQGGEAPFVPCGSANYYDSPSSPTTCNKINGRVTALWTINQVLFGAGYSFTPITY